MNFEQIEIVMGHYNKAVVRCLMAVHWMDDESVAMEQKEGNIDKFNSVIAESDIMLKTLKKNGIKYDDDEVRKGFNIEYRKQRWDKYGY